MSNRISGILVITLIAFCAMILLEARSGIRSADGVKVTPEKDQGAAISGPVRVTLPPLVALSETVERPLFSETRRPLEVESAVPPVSAAPVPLGPSGKFVLSAIVITDDERAVLIDNPQTGEPVRLAEGESIGGWRLDRVETDRATFSREGETREVALRTFEPRAPSRPQRSTAIPPETMTPEQALRRALRENALRPPASPQDSPSSP
jgi:hypothetical protein